MKAPIPAKPASIVMARTILKKSGDAPWLGALAGDLFARVPPEDLAAYAPAAIAGFVRSAGELLRMRTPGTPKISLANAEFPIEGGRRKVTLVEIVNDNMPFLVDSILGELQASGAELLLVTHPIVSVERDRAGKLIAYRGMQAMPAPAIRESLFQAHVAALADEDDRGALAVRLASVVEEVRRAVADWRPMLDRLQAAIDEYRATPPPVAEADVAEAIAFLEWLADDNFTFLGLRDYDHSGMAGAVTLTRAATPGLGILADQAARVLRRGSEGVTVTPAIRAFLKRPEPLIVAKSNLKARVHRRAYADYIGVKRYSGRRLAGETRFIGLFTSTAYTSSVRAIPYLRRKVANILARAGFDPEGHSGKALVNVLESYPRDELFQVDEDLLFDFAMAILALEERPRVRVLSRRDRYDRFVSVIVFVPRDRYDSAVRARIGDYLAAAYDGHISAFYPAFPEGLLARVHFIVGRSGATETPELPRAELEEAVGGIVRTWTDELSRLLGETVEGEEVRRLSTRYGAAFPPAYRDDYSPAAAVNDIAAIESLTPERPLAVDFYRLPSFTPATVGLKLIRLGGPIPLSKRVPMLEHMGFRVIDERSYDILPAGGPSPVDLHDMTLEVDDGASIDLDRLDAALTACFVAVWYEEAESDRYNALVVRAGIGWRDVAFLRAVSRFLHQTGSAYAQDYLAGSLNRNAGIAVLLVDLFHARLDPTGDNPAAADGIRRHIETALEAVQSLDEDQIIRRFANVIGAMVRTNFFQPDRDGRPRAEISFKLDSGKIDGLPTPRPFREIFVHSPRVEGIHLRFGKIARGGIRWSDRPQDFRTEILGLVKAQQVKNAVIVPAGAKGGFVSKRRPANAGRDAIMEEGIAAYRIFISSLLDITDNLDEETVVAPVAVLRHDGDDPYLVVAADKGTATFSDLANGIAAEHGYWLDDAFASGGSTGYDHKKIGITARGAWEAVKRHFREMDRDIQSEAFIAVGVGDMSGDVFGNGMLLSPATKLVAAFDHRDIFIDPDPDPTTSLAERRRLFDLPRSSWQDYDRSKISRGGGVFSRQEKAIVLSREMRTLLDLPGDKATPRDVMRAILAARADLLWFGGIGTFVKGSEETDVEVGDRANDAIRVNAASLRVLVVGEGANLAMTQRARIDFGLAGGHCNTDAIDNSAGVNTSDVEVNIKIALVRARRAGRLTLAKRNALLRAMADEVAGLVLRNNYTQPLAISLAEGRGFEDFGYQLRLMKSLEARGRLDRAVEALPDDAAMASRRVSGKPLTRAEISVLLAYAKIALFDDLAASDIINDPLVAAELLRYFPKRMHKAHAEDIGRHRLRREIAATMLANSMIDRGGPTFVVRLGDGTGANPADIARAFIAVREIFGLRALEAEIDALDNRVSGKTQLALYRTVQDVLLSRTAWFVRNADFSKGVGPVIADHTPAVHALEQALGDVLPRRLAEENEAAAANLAAKGVPPTLTRRIVFLTDLAAAADIHLVASLAKAPLGRAAEVFYAAADQFQISRIASLARVMQVDDYYDGLALERALQVLAEAHRGIVMRAIAAGGASALDSWRAARQETVDRIMQRITALTDFDRLTVSRVTVAANLLADLAKA